MCNCCPIVRACMSAAEQSQDALSYGGVGGGAELESLSCSMLSWDCPLPATLRALSVSVESDDIFSSWQQEGMCAALDRLPALEHFDLVVSWELLVQPVLQALYGRHLTHLSLTCSEFGVDQPADCILPAALEQVIFLRELQGRSRER